MTSQTELFRFGLASLLTGVAVPLAVQLFLVLRNVQRAKATLDRRLDKRCATRETAHRIPDALRKATEAARDAFNETLRASDDSQAA